MSSVEQYKEDIANKYMENFKKDLGFFEKMMIAPISRKMKEILKSDKKIAVNNLKDIEDLGFWRKILGIKIGDKELFEDLTGKLYSFLKEKQEKIIQAQTEGRLEELSNLVINGRLDNLGQRVDNNGETNNGKNDGNDGSGNENQGNDLSGSENGEGNSENGNTEGDKESGVNPVTAGVVTGVGGAAAYHEAISLAEKKLGIDKVKEAPMEFDAKRTKDMMESLAQQMEEKKGSPKLNRVQKKIYEKSIANFKSAANSLDGETADAFKSWQRLQDRMPSTTRKAMNYDKKTLKLIEGLPDEELAKIMDCVDEKAVVKFLDSKGIKISQDLAKQLKIAKTVSEIKDVTKILKSGTKLANVLKGIKGMGVITFLFAGFDVWCYFESKKEAELVSKVNEIRGEVLKDQATVQLLIGMGTVALEALTIVATCVAGGSTTGPWGTVVGLAIGVIAAAASMLYDNLYANKKEFYAQNRYDFINQKRTKIKQSIVQLFESDRLNMHEEMKESIREDRGPNSEIDTMEDAREALIYQEETMKGGYYHLQGYYSSGESESVYKSKLNEEDKKQYEEEKQQMEKIIELRMEYIKQYVKEDRNSKEYNEMKKALSDNKGLEYIEQLLADSKVYAYLKSDNENAYVQNYKELNVQTYKEAYKQKLSQEYSQEFSIFEKIKQENSAHLQEICEGVLASKGSIESSFEDGDSDPCYTEQEIAILKKNIDFVVKYNEYLNLGRPIEKQMTTGVCGDSLDYKYIEQILLDLNSINKRPIWDKESSMRYLSSYEFNDQIEGIENQVSDSVFQNVLYSIAREIHGYTGNNDKMELIGFYTGDGDTTGIYMDDKRKINDVTGFLFFGAKDDAVKNPDNFTKEQALRTIVGEVDLDSDIETGDDNLTNEFRTRVKAIIDREYSYKEHKKDYEKQVVDFITSNNDGQDGYVEIPENIVLNARRAGIGDLHKFLFRVENGQIYALSRGDMVNNVLYFDDSNMKIKYEALNPLRNELTDQEKKLISYVDSMEKKLSKLRSKQGQTLYWTEHEDDLDIPEECERYMSQKSIEWNNLKESLLYMQPTTAHDYLTEKSKEYYDFFNGMYLGLLNTVTNMNHALGTNSNDVNDSPHFLNAMQLIGVDIVNVKDGKLEINGLVNKSIKEYLPTLFDSYKHGTIGKTVKELLMSENENDKELGQELAKKIYELCLEETVLDFDDQGNVDSISTLDFSSNDLEKVKKKLAIGLEGIGFQQAHSEYRSANAQSTEYDYTIRSIEKAEIDSHKEIKILTDNIINTMKEVDRTHKRKQPKFKADAEQNKEGKITGSLSSRGYSEKITVNMNESKNVKSITIDGLGMTFNNPQEGFRIANFINWIKNNIDEHPYGESVNVGSMKYYERDGNELQRHHNGAGGDYEILEEKTLDKYYPSIKNNSKFLKYINSFVK